jgi:hypothetical protein
MTSNQALARYAVVVVIEVLALLACLVPIFSRMDKWQVDCFHVGAATSVVVLVSVVVISLLVFLCPKNQDKNIVDRRIYCCVEIGIWLIYLINIVSLASVIARTGGPSASLYAPLIPIQLSGIIFLHIEKELLVQAKSIAPLLYTLLACLGLLSVHFLSNAYHNLWGFTRDTTVINYSNSNTWLTIAGMVLAFCLYWLPKQKRLIDTFHKLYPA